MRCVQLPKSYASRVSQYPRFPLVEPSDVCRRSRSKDTGLREKAGNCAKPKGKIEDFIELSLRFLANPYKLSETGDFTLRRTLLRLAFDTPPQYYRETGCRTPKTTLPFKPLEGLSSKESVLVRLKGNLSLCFIVVIEKIA